MFAAGILHQSELYRNVRLDLSFQPLNLTLQAHNWNQIPLVLYGSEAATIFEPNWDSQSMHAPLRFNCEFVVLWAPWAYTHHAMFLSAKIVQNI